MLAERVGSLEDSMSKMMAVLDDIHGFMTTDSLHGWYNGVPLRRITQETVHGIVAAIQKHPRVIVDHAWVIVHPSHHEYRDTSISIYLKLKKRVVASQVSKSINEHVLRHLGITSSHARSWDDTDLDMIPEVCKEGPYGKPVVYELKV
jgi:hypothetical protein